MSKADQPPKPAPASREAKLAQALRANLRRRKSGADGGEAKPTKGEPGEPS